MSRSTRRRNKPRRGFTLVESLVALTILMVVLAAIGGLTAATFRSGLHVERHLADVETMQQIIAGLPERSELGKGALAGERAGYRWRLDPEPFEADFIDPRAPVAWAPQKFALRVASPDGAVRTVEMIRLVRTRAP